MPSRIIRIVRAYRRNHVVQGSSLNITIIISLIIGVCMMLMLLTSRHIQNNITKFGQESQLQFNMISAFAMLRAPALNNAFSDRWLRNHSNDDSLLIKTSYWGAYNIAKILTKNRHKSLTESSLFGTFPTADTGLVVEDKSRATSFGGQVILKGNCFLPGGKFEPGTIFGMPYLPVAQNSKYIKNSPSIFPSPSRQFIDGVVNQKTFGGIHDSLVSEIANVFSRSFTKSMVIWEPSKILIQDYNLQGNMRIFADHIIIDSSTILKDVVIVCNKIRFVNSFTGVCHVIARDSIIIEDNCMLNYPSSAILLDAGTAEASSAITVGAKAKIEGALISIAEGSEDSKALIKLHSQSIIMGTIYSGGYLHIGGQLNASVFAKKVIQHSAASIVDNAIANCTIDPGKSRIYPAPNIFDKNSSLHPCKRYD